MKKKAVLLFFTASILATGIFGCGKTKQNNTKENVTDNRVTATEEIAGTESLVEGTENNTTSQLQLGNAVEIPQGWEGKLAETNAHGELEKAIAEYCNVADTDYQKVRYYYNYVDLNGDSKDEILALVLGNEVEGIKGNVLLWIEPGTDNSITKDSVKQAFSNVGAPVYISNHMTEGHRDLIVHRLNETVNAETINNGTTTENTTTTKNGTTKNGTTTTDGTKATTAGAVTTNEAAATKANDAGTATTKAKTNATDTTNGTGTTTRANETAVTDQNYTLLVWTGEKYQDVKEGTVLSTLEGHEGMAILTNDMESDLVNDNYHFLGEAMK